MSSKDAVTATAEVCAQALLHTKPEVIVYESYHLHNKSINILDKVFSTATHNQETTRVQMHYKTKEMPPNHNQ